MEGSEFYDKAFELNRVPGDTFEDDQFSSFQDSELEEDTFRLVADDDTPEWTGSTYEDG